MALLKSKTLSNGITAEYWRISHYLVNKKAGFVTYTLDLFVDEDQIVSLNLAKKATIKLTEEELEGDLISIGYTKIKDIIDSNIVGMNPLHLTFKELVGYEDDI